MPTLVELDGQLLRWYSETSAELDARGMYIFRDEPGGEINMWSPTPTRDLFAPVATLAEAHGVRFLCPKNFAKNGGAVGTHSVYIWFAGSPVPAHIGHNKDGQTVRWTASGTGLADLVLTPSIQEQDEGSPPEWRCGWHGWVGSSGVAAGSAA